MRAMLVVASLLALPAMAQAALFNFDNATIHSPLPVDLTVDGITAHFSGTGQSFSIQEAGVLGFTPVGFSGLCIYPSSVFPADLLVDFSKKLTDFSILYAPEEYDTDTSARMRVTAYLDAAVVGTNTMTAVPGTWPSATLSFSSQSPFNRVVVHYDAPPPTGGDYGPIFMADNMRVTAAPPMLVGDANGDCAVGAADYAIWAAQFGQSGAGLSSDFDGNGSIGAGDYALWAANFGKTCSPAGASVPEPSSGALVLMAAVGLCPLLRRKQAHGVPRRRRLESPGKPTQTHARPPGGA